MNTIARIYHWTLQERWRTWVAHSLLGLGLAPLFGAWTVMVFYGLREVEQVALDGPDDIDWTDHILDFAVPFLVLGLAAAFLGW